MKEKSNLDITNTNDAWILHREEIDTLQEGTCNVYVLLDAYSGFCFAQEISIELPAVTKIISILKTAQSKVGSWPKKILILKKDPFLDAFKLICNDLKLPLNESTTKELQPFVQSFKISFRQFKMGMSQVTGQEAIDDIEQEEAEAFIPESYSPCPCASGKKFKFCCQKAFKSIVFAMCAAEEGQQKEALMHMKHAEEKVGLTPEILCRYAICWAFSDKDKSREYLKQAFELNPKHPRTNYILGIESVDEGNYGLAIDYYQTAIVNYPPEDKFHLNEAYNNIGTAYYELKKYKEAKEAWEKALVQMPKDKMVIQNLFEFIYANPEVPKNLREVSPFIQKYLKK